jgi:hypothetical protein
MPANLFLIFVVVTSDGVVHAETRFAPTSKEKKIDGSTSGGTASLMADLALKHFGLEPDRDVAIVPLRGNRHSLEARSWRAGKHHRCGQRAAKLAIATIVERSLLLIGRLSESSRARKGEKVHHPVVPGDSTVSLRQRRLPTRII